MASDEERREPDPPVADGKAADDPKTEFANLIGRLLARKWLDEQAAARKDKDAEKL